MRTPQKKMALVQTLPLSLLIVAILIPTPLNAQDKVDGRKRVDFSGLVVDDSGKPVAGAEVRHINKPLDSPPIAATTEEGRLAIEMADAEAIERRFLISAEGYAPTLVNFGKTNREQTIVLEPSRGLRLRLVDGEGNPISGVSVVGDDWRNVALIHRMTSDADGCINWTEAPNDAMEFLIKKDGYSPIYNIRFAADEERRNVIMFRVHSIGVKAIDALSGLTLQAFTAVPLLPGTMDRNSRVDRATANQASDGTAQLVVHESKSDTLQVRVEALGYETTTSDPFSTSRPPNTIQVRLKKASPLLGIVVDSDGTAVPNCEVSLASAVQPFELRHPKSNQTTTTDSDGRFSFPSEDSDIWIVAQSSVGCAIHHVKHPPGNSAILGPLRITLRPWATVIGRTSDTANGNRSLIHLSDLSAPREGHPTIDLQQYVPIDDDGRFRFERVFPGSYSISRNVSPFRDDRLMSSEVLPLVLTSGQIWTGQVDRVGTTIVGQIKTETAPSDSTKQTFRWSLVYLVPLEESTGPSITLETSRSLAEEGFRNLAVARTTEGTYAMRGIRHWVAKLNDDGKFQISGVPPGQYDLFINVFDPPKDGCLTVPIASAISRIEIADDRSETVIEPITLETSSTLAMGDTLPEIHLLLDDGTETTASQIQRDRPMLIQFWAPWCAPCLREFPEVAELAERIEGSEAIILSVCIEQAQVPKRWSDHTSSNWFHGYLTASDSEMLRKLSMSSVPMHFVVGPEHKLVALERDLSAALRQLERIQKLPDTARN